MCFYIYHLGCLNQLLFSYKLLLSEHIQQLIYVLLLWVFNTNKMKSRAKHFGYIYHLGYQAQLLFSYKLSNLCFYVNYYNITCQVFNRFKQTFWDKKIRQTNNFFVKFQQNCKKSIKFTKYSYFCCKFLKFSIDNCCFWC